MRSLSILALLAASGCAVQPAAYIPPTPDPADPAAATGPRPYVPVTAGTVDYRPVEAGAWRELNRRVAPTSGRAP